MVIAKGKGNCNRNANLFFFRWSSANQVVELWVTDLHLEILYPKEYAFLINYNKCIIWKNKVGLKFLLVTWNPFQKTTYARKKKKKKKKKKNERLTFYEIIILFYAMCIRIFQQILTDQKKNELYFKSVRFSLLFVFIYVDAILLADRLSNKVI